MDADSMGNIGNEMARRLFGLGEFTRPSRAVSSKKQLDEHPLEKLQRQARADHRQTAVVRRRLVGHQAQELAQREAVPAAPGDPASRAEHLEVTHQQHPEVHAGIDAGAARVVGVVRGAQLLDEALEVRLHKQAVQRRIEGVTGRARKLALSDPQRLLRGFASAQGDGPSLFGKGIAGDPVQTCIIPGLGCLSTGCWEDQEVDTW